MFVVIRVLKEAHPLFLELEDSLVIFSKLLFSQHVLAGATLLEC